RTPHRTARHAEERRRRPGHGDRDRRWDRRPYRRAAGDDRRRAVRSSTSGRRRAGPARRLPRRTRKAGSQFVTEHSDGSNTHRAGPVDEPTAADTRAALTALRGEVAKAVVGQDAVVTGLVIALLCRGHVLLEGVPGVAKTLLIRTLAQALKLDFKR